MPVDEPIDAPEVDAAPSAHDPLGSDAAPPPPPGRQRRTLLVGLCAIAVVAALVGALVLLGGGDGGSDGPSSDRVDAVDLATVAEASRSTTAKAVVVQERTDGTTDRAEGAIDFEHRAAELLGPLGTRSASGDEVDPETVPAPFRKMFEVLEAADGLVLIGDHAYIRAKGTWWDLGPSMDESSDGIDVFSPGSILDQLAELGKVRPVGSGEVRGTPATRYTTTQSSTGDRFDVWIDGDGRPVRIVRSYGDPDPGGVAEETTDLFDFGAPVDIRAPAQSQPLAPFGAGAAGDGPGGAADAIDLREVASGADHGISWTLSTGVLADGRACVQVATDPGVDGEVVDLAADGTSSTSFDVPAGSPVAASCGPATQGDRGGSGARVLTVGGKRAEAHYLAGLLADGAEVTISFADGREQQLVGHDGAFIVVFAGDDWPTAITGTSTSCELPGDDTISGHDDLC